jgi:HEAT repeat protein
MRATQALGNLHDAGGDPRIHDAVIGALRDPAAGVRRGAAGALAKIGGAAVAEELFALLRDGDTGVQAAAVEALGAIGETLEDNALRVKIVRALLELPSRTPYGMYQRARGQLSPGNCADRRGGPARAAETLERYNRASEIASEALGIIAIQATNPLVRVQVVMSLLTTAWEPDVLLADAVVRVLGSVTPRLPELHLFDRVITELLDLFHATGPMLLEVHDGVPETITAYLEGRRLDYLRPTLVQTLGRLGAASEDAARRTVPVLIEAMYDLDPLVWLHALGELRQIAAVFPEEAAAAVPALARHLGDHSLPALHEAPRSELAAAVLRQIGTEEALQALNGWGRGKAG